MKMRAMIAVLRTFATSMTQQPEKKRPVVIIHSPTILTGNSNTIGMQSTTSAAIGARRVSFESSQPKKPEPAQPREQAHEAGPQPLLEEEQQRAAEEQRRTQTTTRRGHPCIGRDRHVDC